MFSKADIEKYFLVEKSLSTVFMILGAIAIVAAIIFFFVVKTNLFKGASIPFLLIGILQLTAAYNVYRNADENRKALAYAYDMNPSLLKDKELPRMEKVTTTFNYLLIGEVLFIVIGIALFIYFKNDAAKAFWVGIGLALAAEAAITLTADLAAKKRASTYKEGLKEFTGK